MPDAMTIGAEHNALLQLLQELVVDSPEQTNLDLLLRRIEMVKIIYATVKGLTAISADVSEQLY